MWQRYNQTTQIFEKSTDNGANWAPLPLGIVFGSSSASPTVLDHYSEGSWTPAFGGSAGQSGQVYAHNIGIYTKVGDLVHIQGSIALSTLGTITGSLRIINLPFTAHASIGRAAIAVGYFGGLATTAAFLGGYITASSNWVDIIHMPAAGGTVVSSLLQGNLTAGFNVLFFASYKAAS